MISVSDSTATDALIALLGRESIENYTALNRPLLTTREVSTLKHPAMQITWRRTPGRRDPA